MPSFIRVHFFGKWCIAGRQENAETRDGDSSCATRMNDVLFPVLTS